MKAKTKQKLLNDLALAQAVIMGYEYYCKSIGKYTDAIIFVKAFINKLESDGKGEA